MALGTCHAGDQALGVGARQVPRPGGHQARHGVRIPLENGRHGGSRLLGCHNGTLIVAGPAGRGLGARPANRQQQGTQA